MDALSNFPILSSTILARIPEDNLRLIFKFLDVSSLARVSTACSPLHARVICWYTPKLQSLFLCQQLLHSASHVEVLERNLAQSKWVVNPYKSKDPDYQWPNLPAVYTKLGDISDKFAIYHSKGCHHAIIGPNNRHLALDLGELLRGVTDKWPGDLMSCGKISAGLSDGEQKEDAEKSHGICFYTIFRGGTAAIWRLESETETCLLLKYVDFPIPEGASLTQSFVFNNWLLAKVFVPNQSEEVGLFFNINDSIALELTDATLIELMSSNFEIANNDKNIFLLNYAKKKIAAFTISSSKNKACIKCNWSVSVPQCRKLVCNNQILAVHTDSHQLIVLQAEDGKLLSATDVGPHFKVETMRLQRGLILWQVLARSEEDEVILNELHLMQKHGVRFVMPQPQLHELNFKRQYLDLDLTRTATMLQVNILYKEAHRHHPNYRYHCVSSFTTHRIVSALVG